MVLNGVNFPDAEISQFCQRHGVRNLSLFGSILRESSVEGAFGFRPTSDVDVLVDFFDGCMPSLLDFAGMQLELSALIEREVQLQTSSMLSPSFRERVVGEARVQYAA